MPKKVVNIDKDGKVVNHGNAPSVPENTLRDHTVVQNNEMDVTDAAEVDQTSIPIDFEFEETPRLPLWDDLFTREEEEELRDALSMILFPVADNRQLTSPIRAFPEIHVSTVTPVLRQLLNGTAISENTRHHPGTDQPFPDETARSLLRGSSFVRVYIGNRAPLNTGIPDVEAEERSNPLPNNATVANGAQMESPQNEGDPASNAEQNAIPGTLAFSQKMKDDFDQFVLSLGGDAPLPQINDSTPGPGPHSLGVYRIPPHLLFEEVFGSGAKLSGARYPKEERASAGRRRSDTHSRGEKKKTRKTDQSK